MGLPTSREPGVGPEQPVPSAVTLAIMDNIVGQKFKSTPLMIPGGLFRADLGRSAGATLSGTTWTVNPTVSVELICDLLTLSFMPGTRVTSLAWSGTFSVGTSTNGLLFKLRKRSFGDNGTTTGNAISDQTLVSGNGTLLHESVTAPYFTEPNMMYQLSILFPTGSYTFDGARLVLDRL